MSYPSRAYKVQPMFKVLYNCCIDVVKTDKSPLTNALLIQVFGPNKTRELERYDFNELIIVMIEHLKYQVYKNSYEEVAMSVKTHDRFLSLIELYKQREEPQYLTSISFRIPESTVEDIYKLKHVKLGEVIELAVAYFITACDDDAYNLIYAAFKHYP